MTNKSGTAYKVKLDPHGNGSCTCPDFQERIAREGRICKHIAAAAITADIEQWRKRKRELETEVGRLTEAIASGSSGKAPAAIVAAIAAKEREINSIHEKLLSSGPDSIEERVREIRRFVMTRLADVRQLLGSDVPTAKAELRKHIDRIELTPVELDGEKIFAASGEWNLLGGYGDAPRNAGGAGGQS